MSCPYDAHNPENTSRGSNVDLTLGQTFFGWGVPIKNHSHYNSAKNRASILILKAVPILYMRYNGLPQNYGK